MVRGRSYPQVVGLAIGADNHAYHDPCGRASGGPSRHCRIGRVNRRRHLNGTEGGWPSLSVADAMIKRVPHSSRTLRRVGTMQLAVPFFDFPENLIIQAARTRPCKKRKDGAPFSYFVPELLKAGPPALKTLNPSTALRDHHHVTPDRSGSAAKGKTRACPLL